MGKIAVHCRKKNWGVELEPRVRHDDGQFYQPDLAVHITSSRIVIADVQVSWDGS